MWILICTKIIKTKSKIIGINSINYRHILHKVYHRVHGNLPSLRINYSLTFKTVLTPIDVDAQY